ncbi:MAG TPA: protein kinase [Bryobacteraceae bacterium]|nr:protein kinase [Bryobacteraceae bacterium]
MGRVFRATRPGRAVKKPVALKLLPWVRASSDFERRFKREIELHARLEHPLIARLLDGGTADGTLFLVTELIDGTPVTEFAKSRSLEDRLRLFVRICEAVEFAHRNLIVHRDLKPSNILVSSDGVPHLLDFGIAKLLGDVEENPLTKSGIVPMTPEYASPEQVRGLPVTTATDVYSLGVLLYEILAGKRPYSLHSHSLDEIVQVVCNRDPALPSSAVRELKGDLDAIVMKALRKEPDERYSSVEALRQDVERHLAGLPVDAARGSALYRFSKFVHRNRVAVGLTSLTIAALLGGVATTIWQARIAQAERIVAEHERVRAKEQATEATAQRDRAESLSRQEQEQRRAAERNAAEAERQRKSADTERAKAESRFQDVRQVATNLLFDFDEAIVNVQGTNKARELIVEKGLSYLDKLSSETSGNDSLQEEIAVAYERLAGIQGNVFQSSRGDYKKAREGYEKAVAIRQALLNKHPGDSRYQRALALSKIELADGMYTSGELKSGITLHKDAVATLHQLSAAGDKSSAIPQGIQRSNTRLCTLLLADSNITEALLRCRAAVASGKELLAADPKAALMRSGLAASLSQLGLALRTNKQPLESIEVLELAALEHQILSETDPTNSRHVSNVAGSYALIGGTWTSLGERGKAIVAFQRGIETNRQMLRVDRNDARAKTTLAFGLVRLAPMLLAEGQKSEAIGAAKEGLDIFRSFADRQNATPDDLNNFASFVLEVGVPELRNPALALSYSKRAVAGVQQPSLVLFDTLADAFSETGDTSSAIDVLMKALAAHPASTASPIAGLRSRIEEKLKQLKSSAAKN